LDVFCKYRCPSGPPGPARARARPGPVTSGPCLARPYYLKGRARSAHGLRRRPRHGPTGLFRAGPAQKACRPPPCSCLRRPHASVRRPATAAAPTGRTPRGRAHRRRATGHARQAPADAATPPAMPASRSRRPSSCHRARWLASLAAAAAPAGFRRLPPPKSRLDLLLRQREGAEPRPADVRRRREDGGSSGRKGSAGAGEPRAAERRLRLPGGDDGGREASEVGGWRRRRVGGAAAPVSLSGGMTEERRGRGSGRGGGRGWCLLGRGSGPPTGRPVNPCRAVPAHGLG